MGIAWPKEFVETLDFLAKNIAKNMLVSEAEAECNWPMTVCVGDLQPLNILRRTDGTDKLVFIDFQLSMLSEGHGTDIGYFLMWVLSPSERRKHEKRIIHKHYDAMIAAGMDGSIYPFSLYFLRYKVLTQFSFVKLALALAGINRTEDRYIAAVIYESLSAFIKDHGSMYDNWVESVRQRKALMLKLNKDGGRTII